jgi:hypothetical protein
MGCVTETNMKRLCAWERKILRMYRPVVQQGIWRRRTGQELRKLYNDLDIVSDIKKKWLELTVM